MPNSRRLIQAGGGDPAASRPWWLGAAVVAIGCICLYGAFSLPQGARYAGIGPGLFVTMIGGGLVVLGLIFLVQIARGEASVPEDADDAEKADMPALLTALAAAGVPILTIQALGLPVTALLSFTLVARAFGSRNTVADIVTGAVLGVVSWLIFTRLGLHLGGILPVAGV